MYFEINLAEGLSTLADSVLKMYESVISGATFESDVLCITLLRLVSVFNLCSLIIYDSCLALLPSIRSCARSCQSAVECQNGFTKLNSWRKNCEKAGGKFAIEKTRKEN